MDPDFSQIFCRLSELRLSNTLYKKRLKFKKKSFQKMEIVRYIQYLNINKNRKIDKIFMKKFGYDSKL